MISVVYATYRTAWKPSVSNNEICTVEAPVRSSSSPASLVSPITRHQTSHSPQSTWSTPSPYASPSLDLMLVTPDNPDATFATKRLAIDADNCTTTCYRHSADVKTDASLSVYTAREASAFELFPSARPFAGFAEVVRSPHNLQTAWTLTRSVATLPIITGYTPEWLYSCQNRRAGESSPLLELKRSPVRNRAKFPDSRYVAGISSLRHS